MCIRDSGGRCGSRRDETTEFDRKGQCKSKKRGVLDQRVLWRQCCSIAAEMDFMDFMDKVKIKSILSIRSIYCHSG